MPDSGDPLSAALKKTFVGGYIPTSVQPTSSYPYNTDWQFIHQKVRDEPYADMKKSVPGMHAVPTMDLEGGAEGTGIFEIDGKFHVLPTQINGEKFEGDAAVERFRKTGEHLGIFHAEDDASIFEQQYLGDIGKNNKPSLLKGDQSGGSEAVTDTTQKKTSNDDALSAALQGSRFVPLKEKVADPEGFLQEQDHSDTPLTPNDLDTRHRVQDTINERNRKEKMNEDPLASALKKTFTAPGNGSHFPAIAQNDRQDLLKDIDNAFYGGGQSQPTPTPTPSAVKPHQMTLEQLYDHFGVDNPVRVVGNYGRPLYQNQPDLQVYKAQYGYGS